MHERKPERPVPLKELLDSERRSTSRGRESTEPSSSHTSSSGAFAEPGFRKPNGRSPALVLKEIGHRFTEKRHTDRVGAYKQLQEDLMNHAHELVPFVVSLKEVLGTTIDIEDFLKGSESNTGRSPLEEVQDFLTFTSKPKERVN